MKETIAHYLSQGLDDMRRSIDNLDTSLFHLIAERVHLIVHLSAYKIEHAIALTRSSQRELDLQQMLVNIAIADVGQPFFYQFFDAVYDYALAIMHYMNNHHDMVNNYLQNTSDKIKITRQMDEYRLLLQNLDHSICYVLRYRFDVVHRIGLFKKSQGMVIKSPQRWQQVIHHQRRMAQLAYIDDNFIEKLFALIHNESLRIENEIQSDR